MYNINIDWANDATVNTIDLNIPRIQRLLSIINANKACGPEGIHGRVLKNCSQGLAYPLSIIFKLSYNTGILPADWKNANIVPVNRKGC